MARVHEAWKWLARFLSFAGRVLGSFLRNRGILLAGGVGYNALLSLVPFLTLTVAALSLFFDQEQILQLLRRELVNFVPQHTETILQTVQAFLNNQAAINAVSIVVLVFFSSIALRMLENAMAAIFHT